MKVRLLDIVCIAAVALMALAAGLPYLISDNGGSVTVRYDKGTITLPLDRDDECVIVSCGHTLTVKIESGEVYVSDADCDDKLCERTGRISKASQSIACLPSKVLIRIESQGGVDGVAG